MNNPYPTKQQLEREDTMSEAQDILGEYEKARDKLIEFATLSIPDIAFSLWNLEGEIFFYNVKRDCKTLDEKITAQKIIDALEDESPEGAKEAIDDHFAAYLEQARALAAGEV